eukprot:CAMPEP_0180237224 /NCGR_PEP_ID=MMETSP0987-20121128/30238_1 /TAXON_ID=697907 /ORGANISM="non described non described, Strain CCMP2293" /LENGTH=194 /DNA_ID=CAMNT_0022203581 /DNA_START=85 /DNA_END=667 /DNA_ORIENTATION=-
MTPPCAASGGWLGTPLAAATSRAAVSAIMSSTTSCEEGMMSNPGEHAEAPCRRKAPSPNRGKELSRLDAMHALVRDGVAVRARDFEEVAGAHRMHRHVLASHPLLTALVCARNGLHWAGRYKVISEIRHGALPQATLTMITAHPQPPDHGLKRADALELALARVLPTGWAGGALALHYRQVARLTETVPLPAPA